jgi:hypothetical protein
MFYYENSIKKNDVGISSINSELLCTVVTRIYSTVGAQSIAHAQSIARRHTTYVIMQKKLTFREFFFGKIKKEQFERRIFKRKSAFSPLKLLNKHFSKMSFFL